MPDINEAPYTGLTACVKIGSGADAKVLAYISGADLTLEKDIIEILAFGMTFKEKVPAIKDWSLSLDGTVALASGGTQEQLYAAFDDGSPLTIGIFLDDNTYFEGTGYVSSFNISAAPDDKISLSSEIAGSGATILTMPSQAVATPVATPGAGAVAADTTVTLSCATAGATIYYTTNGTTPTSSSTAYTTAITVSTAMVIKAIAVKDGMSNSAVLTAEYTIST